MKKLWNTISVVIAVLAIGALGYFSVGSADEPPPVPPPQSIEEKILGAKTPADHEAIAAYYDKEAKDAHEKHLKHQKMEEYYKKNAALNKSGFSTHCDIIAANYDKTAKEYDALAKLHRDMVKSTQ
jgi:ABC-type metal ion transport system substrate-binding protein